MKQFFYSLLILFISFSSIQADEGMWMLPLIEELNMQEMKNLGLTMSAGEIYSTENPSLKDAVVNFSNGCSGVVVSNSGLVFTNHHCGYSAIQKLSSIENNYLRDGFSADELKDELPCEGVTITFLVKIENVTERINAGLKDFTGEKRKDVLSNLLVAIQNEATANNHYSAQVKSFYSGNEYYLIVSETFNDIRLAFTPPSSIGKFGGETDNWMYPRHTGDFAVFRVYADKNGKPASYSDENMPYMPKKFARISNQGYAEGDYAMILGYPGTTDRYATSFAIKNRVKNGNSARIEMRGVKQDAWRKFMLADEAVNIAYADKYARSSNYWKNSIGMNNAIKKLNVIAEKEKHEQDFEKWVNRNSERKAKYGHVLAELKSDYELISANQHAIDYLRESLSNGVELPRIANNIRNSVNPNSTVESNLEKAAAAYKDYYPDVDQNAFAALLEAYRNAVSESYLPETYKTIDKKFKGNYANFVSDLFRKSTFTTKEKLAKSLKKKNFTFSKDPAIIFYTDIQKKMSDLRTKEYNQALERIEANKKLYQKGLMEWADEKNSKIYPDANFSMRLTYGQILGYNPADATTYNYYTTAKGILEKEDPANPEFIVPENLKSEIVHKNFGEYTDKKTGEMHINFISNNDITGGNSGSPVFNAKGEVLGLAFDGNWEAMSGDIIFENELQRTINVDVRYMLFVMDKLGGAERLIKELTIK